MKNTTFHENWYALFNNVLSPISIIIFLKVLQVLNLFIYFWNCRVPLRRELWSSPSSNSSIGSSIFFFLFPIQMILAENEAAECWKSNWARSNGGSCWRIFHWNSKFRAVSVVHLALFYGKIPFRVSNLDNLLGQTITAEKYCHHVTQLWWNRSKTSKSGQSKRH